MYKIDELPEGGMGIKLMSRLADRLSYIHTLDQRNCLLIVKNYEKKGFDSSPAFLRSNLLEQLIELFNRLLWFKNKRQRQQSCATPLQKIYLQANTDLNELENIFQWFKQLEHLLIPKIVWVQYQLALAEGFTNAVRHAHKGLPLETPIELEVTVFKEKLEIRIWDYGQPFDLEAKFRELKERDLEIPTLMLRNVLESSYS